MSSNHATQIPKLIQIEDYEPLIGVETVERIREKAKSLQGFHIANINSTFYGGGVAELLNSLTLLMNSLGLKAGWRTINGRTDFFRITKKMHNALQGGPFHRTDRKYEIYEQVLYENSVRMHLKHDCVIVHDPQPLGLIQYYAKKGSWLWRCHIDLSKPNRDLWDYLAPFIERYDGAILSSEAYSQKLTIPQHFFMPAIDPFTVKNRAFLEDEVNERLEHHRIPTDLPLVVQVSRFDRWKDPQGVIRAFKLARKEVDCTLVLLGNYATDDPEGQEIFESLLGSQEERILVLASGDDTALVNALQTKATVVLQKSTREGFGLTVTEAMWKGTPVIGGNVGGIRNQIEDGVNGFLVSSIEQTANRIVRVLKNPELREQLGKRAKESVQQKFLMTRLLEQYLDLFRSL